MTNHSSYLEISFTYFIIPSKTSTPKLKMKISYQNTYWIFDSEKMRTDVYKWKTETICTNVNPNNNYAGTQVIFEGAVQDATAIGLDNVTVGECLHRLRLTCFFENDVCSWVMSPATVGFTPWEIVRKSEHISPRTQNTLYLQVKPNKGKQYAQLTSPSLIGSNVTHFNMWYFVNDKENVTSTLKIGLQTLHALLWLWTYNQSENGTGLHAQWTKISLNITDIREDSKVRTKLLCINWLPCNKYIYFLRS
uniref:MAM domain-containing protein n=1 Tax=Strigamia maritima TaxID=126957 RepID=T1IQ01_STRMM